MRDRLLCLCIRLLQNSFDCTCCVVDVVVVTAGASVKVVTRIEFVAEIPGS